MSKNDTQSAELSAVKYPKVYVVQMEWSCGGERNIVENIGAYTDKELAIAAMQKHVEQIKQDTSTWEHDALEDSENFEVEEGKMRWSISMIDRYDEQHTQVFVTEFDLKG